MATPWVGIPAGAGDGLPAALGVTRIGSSDFTWGQRTYVMGIINVTPNSFSGDGLMESVPGAGPGPNRVAAAVDRVAAAVDQARRMVEEGADILDVGGESTRPGHEPVDVTEELDRVVPVVAAIRAAFPGVPISVDTTKAGVATAALDAGADLVNDIWGVAAEPELLGLVAERRVPIVLMHNRAEARYVNFFAEVVADLQQAIERALGAGVEWGQLIVDPGFGFGKAPVHNLALLRDLAMLRVLGRPILLGTSRKSTLGKVLDLPADQRLEATVATTALGIAAGVDMVRVHDVRANVRAARMTDAVVRR